MILAAIERHEDPALCCRGCQQTLVWRAGQLLITRKRHVVTGIPENRPDGIGNILVELDRSHSYAAGMGTIVSRASSAA